MSGKQPIADRIKDRPKEDARIEYADPADKGMHSHGARLTRGFRRCRGAATRSQSLRI